MVETWFDKVRLAIIDKLLLGSVLAAIGYFASRELEQFKSREAVRKVLTERRLLAILDLWTQLRQLHWDLHSYSVDLLGRAAERARDQETPFALARDTVLKEMTLDGSSLSNRAKSLIAITDQQIHLLGPLLFTAMHRAVVEEHVAVHSLGSSSAAEEPRPSCCDYEWLAAVIDGTPEAGFAMLLDDPLLKQSYDAFVSRWALNPATPFSSKYISPMPPTRWARIRERVSGWPFRERKPALERR